MRSNLPGDVIDALVVTPVFNMKITMTKRVTYRFMITKFTKHFDSITSFQGNPSMKAELEQRFCPII